MEKLIKCGIKINVVDSGYSIGYVLKSLEEMGFYIPSYIYENKFLVDYIYVDVYGCITWGYNRNDFDYSDKVETSLVNIKSYILNGSETDTTKTSNTENNTDTDFKELVKKIISCDFNDKVTVKLIKSIL